MSLVSKASKAFKKLKAAAKTGFGNNVVTCLTGLIPSQKDQPDFSNLPVPLATLQSLTDVLATCVANAHNGGRSNSLALKAAVANWNVAFSETADYISSVAAGNPLAISDTGFIPTKNGKQASVRPGAVSQFKATINGSRGAVIASAKRGAAGAKFYIYTAVADGAEVSYNGNTTIITIGGKSIYIQADTRRQTEMFDLPSGVPYNISMYGINSAGSGPATPAQQVIPQ